VISYAVRVAARRISFVNFKGGVGKTSLAVNIAAHLACIRGKRTLLVDMDPQSNSSQWLLRSALWKKINERPEHSVYAIFLDGPRGVGQNSIEVPECGGDEQAKGKLFILPSSYRLMDLDQKYTEQPGVPYYLHFLNEIKVFFPHYDYIIFDCPPNPYRGTICALFASQEIFVPCNPDMLSYSGLSYLVEKLKIIKDMIAANGYLRGYRRFAAIRGIIMNDANSRANYDEITGKFESKLLSIRQVLPDIVFPDVQILAPMIRAYEAARKAAYEEKPVFLLGKSSLADDYAAIGDAIDAMR